ncbi:hypothetical protein PoB_000223000 [Plakobranchus ocellatus]|uniref:MYND-type domain-containing protein n=1 Tax=Plakobranchus ocellatus TaxID=259542 RepID=A0AAV3XY38_9GAST|nr:hypothetical protein PoB_000223000 [Plakobranchus ocellatus]
MATGGNSRNFDAFYGDLENDRQRANSSQPESVGADKSRGKSKASTKDHTSDKNKTSTKDHTSDKSKSFGGAQNKNQRKMSTEYREENGFPAIAVHTEWTGGPPPRTYRRNYQKVQKMRPQMCPDGEKVKRLENEVMSSPSNVCKFCKKKSSEGFRRCSRCLAVSYCDRDCQKVDFNNHKLFCRRCERYDIARARVYPAVPIFCSLRHGGDFSVLLREMPLEFQYDLGDTLCNVLLEFLGQIFHICRYACLVRDLSGQTTKIVFHDPSNLYCHPVFGEPSAPPRDLASCLKPGHFLLLVGVHWRIFMDGSVGIRVNDLNSMYIIDMADQEMSKEYKADVAQKLLEYDDSPTIF